MNNKYIYFFNYDDHERDFFEMEARNIFSQEVEHKLLFSNINIDPSCSAFIRKRLDIIVAAEEHSCLINKIKNKKIYIEGFKVEYLVLDGDTTEYKQRLEKLKDIGYSIEGIPNYYTPTRTYALCYFKGIWYFGTLIKNNIDWHKHKHKPCSYSNSLDMNIAKTLVNIAAQGNKENRLIDVCCGVGTIMLEACFAGYNIEGCDINAKICNDARENLAHFNYDANVICSDIKDISKNYDAAIIDLPYNLFSYASDDDILNIIQSTARITDRLVIVSGSDMSSLISMSGLKIIDHCSLKKRGNTSFTRKIWLCDKH
ncbi:MAG: methyltransferase domain-containing protein [Candidatus Neomarinimicrobiota bacterium]|jgi:tRNA G10  N-methylase Trm11